MSGRFWTKVDENGPTPAHAPELGPCWLWTAPLLRNGYGSFHVPGSGKYGRSQLAHIWSWEKEHGEVPDGLDLDHLCRDRACVRPSHLEPVTRLENVQRGQGHGSETYCPHGHPYDEENTYISVGQGHKCREC